MKKENAGFKVFEENFVDDGLTNEDGSPVMSLDIVKYSIWSKGRINPLKEGFPKMQVDDTVYFNEDVKGLERLK